MPQGQLAEIIPRPGALNSIPRIRDELARVYRDARTGRIPTGEATRLAYILNVMARLIETGELEARIEKLERES